MLRTITIPIDGPAGCGGAITVLAWLAYPRSADKRKRLHFANACFSMGVRRRRWARSDPLLRSKVARLPAEAFSLKGMMSRRDVNNELSRAHRLIGKRLLAAEMQAHQMLRIFDNRQFPVDGNLVRLRIKGASTRRLATAIAQENRQDIEQARVNVITRVWSETKPVMHIAAALRLWLEQQKGKTIKVGLIGKPGETRPVDLADLDIVQLVCCPDWLAEVLLWADAFQLPVIENKVAPGMKGVRVRFLPTI